MNGRLRNRFKVFFSFPEESVAFGIPMSGRTKKDLYIFIFACTIGIFFGVITGYPGSSPLFSAFLKDELGMSNTLYGILMALPYFLAVLQIPFAAFLHRRPKIKTYYILFSLITRLNFPLLGFLTYFFGSIGQNKLIIIVFFIQSFTSVFWWVSDLCFNLWSGHVCPSACSGRFFSTRQMFFTAAQLIYASALTIMLKFLGNSPEKYLLLFSIAGVFGCLEILSFIFVRPPEIKALSENKEEKATAAYLLAPFRHKAYRNFLLFTTLWYFGNFIQGPFTNVFMLEYLNLPISRQTLYGTLLPGFATILFIRGSGRLSDHYGYRNTLLLYSGISSMLTLVWLFVTPETEALIAVGNICWGIVGTATDLSIFSLGIYLAPEDERAGFLSAKTVCMNLIGIAPAIMLGGIIMDHLQPFLKRANLPFILGQKLLPFHVIIIVAFILRLASVLLFARRLDADSELNFTGFLKKLLQGLHFRFRLSSGLFNRRRK